MAEFTPVAVIVRQICNGILALSSLSLGLVFFRYAYLKYSRKMIWFKQELETNAALSIFLLLLGMSLRAFIGWLQFIWTDLELDPSPFINTNIYFIGATFVTLIGASMTAYFFGPVNWKKSWLAATIFTIVAIPVGMAFILSFW